MDQNQAQEASWGGLSGGLALALFCSGAAGLIYQTLWVRMLSVSLGSSAEAVCLVLSVFMAGMALGSALLGKKADLAACPLRLYALLEAALGLYALLTPALFGSLPGMWAVAFMVPPTLLMGGTLPVLASALNRGSRSLGESVARLYFWNTLGGAAGALAAGFFLIAAFGVSGSCAVAALACWSAALLAMRFAAASPGAASDRAIGEGMPPTKFVGNAAEIRQEAALKPATRARLWLLFCLSGLMALAYEALWTRLLALVLGSSVYAFSLMLAAFLTGIALGSRLAARWVEKSSCRVGFWGLFQLALGALSLAALAAYREAPSAYLWLYSLLGETPRIFAPAQFLLAFLILLGPTLMMGMGFPWFVKIMQSSAPGQGTGLAYAVNTLGAAAGPWLATFLLVPVLGLPGAVAAVAFLSLGLGCWAMGLEERGHFKIAAPWALAGSLALGTAIPALAPADLQHGVSIYAHKMAASGGARSWRGYRPGQKLLFSEDGVSASVSVWRQPGGQRNLVINGKVDASDGAADMPTQLLLGHLPLLVSPAGERPGARVLVIGLGSGVTLGAAARHPVAALTVVEIEPAVVRAAQHFEHVNRRALRDSRVTLLEDDARRHLRQNSSTYDAIMSAPSNPWISGMGHLFSAEFYALARANLAPGGIYCQWFQLYGMTPKALASGLKTFSASFAHAEAWSVGGDLLLLGSSAPLALDWEAMERRLARTGARQDLSPWGLGQVPDLLAHRVMGPAGLRSLAGPGTRPHTDYKPVLDFEAPKALRDPGALARNLALLEEASEPASLLWPPDAMRSRWVARSLLAARRAWAAEREMGFLDRKDPWYPGLQRNLGELYLRLGSAAEAVSVFERGVAERPSDPAAYLDLARARLEVKDREGAIAALEGFLARNREEKIARAVARAKSEPRPALAYLAAGMGYARIAEGRLAAEAFARALELEPRAFGRMLEEGNGALD